MFRLFGAIIVSTVDAASRMSWNAAINHLQRIQDNSNLKLGNGLGLHVIDLQTAFDGLSDVQILAIGNEVEVGNVGQHISDAADALMQITTAPTSLPTTTLTGVCDDVDGFRDCLSTSTNPGYGAGSNYDAVQSLGQTPSDDALRSDADLQAALLIARNSLELASTAIEFVCEALPDTLGADSACWAGAGATAIAAETITLIFEAADFVDGTVDSAEILQTYQNSRILMKQNDDEHNELIRHDLEIQDLVNNFDRQQEDLAISTALFNPPGTPDAMFYLPHPYGNPGIERVNEYSHKVYDAHIAAGMDVSKATMWLDACDSSLSDLNYRDAFQSCSFAVRRLA